MGSILSSDRVQKDVLSSERELRDVVLPEDPNPSFDCAVCLEVLNTPMRTRCGHVFCQICIKLSLRNNSCVCPYCRARLSSEGTPAEDIMEKMKTVFKNCEECEEKVCLSEMRAHLNTCQQYLTKYGPQIEMAQEAGSEELYTCPFCPLTLDEDRFVEHCFTQHLSETSPVMCPICRLMPGEDPSYDYGFLRHLHFRHTVYYDYILDGAYESLRGFAPHW